MLPAMCVVCSCMTWWETIQADAASNVCGVCVHYLDSGGDELGGELPFPGQPVLLGRQQHGVPRCHGTDTSQTGEHTGVTSDR